MCISTLRVSHIRTKTQCAMHTIVRLRVLSWIRYSVRMIWLRRRHPRTVMPSTSYRRWIRRSSTLRSTPTDLPKSAAPPHVRSPTTPVARGSATPIHAGSHPLAEPRIPALPLPGFAGPLPPEQHESRMFSTADPPLGGSPQLAGDSCFSDIEDDGDGAGSAFLPDGTHDFAATPTAHRPCMSVVCSARRDSVRLGTYGYTRRPYVGPGMLVAQIAGRRAELAFLRSTWPRRPSQPADIAPERTTPTAVILADPPSPWGDCGCCWWRR